MARMARSCLMATIVWIVLAAAYTILLIGQVPFPFPIAVATVVWIGLQLVHSSRSALRDWRARNRLARGERPLDGELVSAVGEIRPQAGEVLQAPLSGRACVLYTYDIGRTRDTESASRDYVGFAMTRCAVHTPYGAFHLGSFPVLENVPRDSAEGEPVARYVRATTFAPFPGVTGMIKSVLSLHTQKPPLQVDWQIGTPDAFPSHGEERVIEPGTTVTAIGRYEARSNAIVGDADEQGLLRLRPGGSARRVSPFPGDAVTKALGGLFFVIAPNVMLWWWLVVSGLMPRR